MKTVDTGQISPVPGGIAVSKAGRDSGREFIIIRLLEIPFILVADGSLRRVERPKKKNVKHLKITGFVVDDIKDRLEKRLKLSNADVRKAIAFYKAGTEGGY